MTRLVAACALALFVPLLIPLATGRLFTMDDLAFFHVPTRFVYSQALTAGDRFWWTPALASGLYLHGEGQVGMLHPLHLFLYSTFPFAVAFNLDLVSSYVIALAGTAVMLRRFGLSLAGSLFGGLLFAFSGFNLMHLLHVNAIAVAAHLPWLIAAADTVLRAERARTRATGAIALSVLLGSALLMGFPQFVLLSMLVVAAFVIWQTVSMRRWAPLAWLGAAVIVGAALGAIQVLPMLDAGSTSLRRETSAVFALSYSLHPLNLVQLVAPYVIRGRAFVTPGELAIHESTVYDSAFGTLAIGWAVLRRRSLPAGPLVTWALAVCAVSLVLALGRYGGLYVPFASLPILDWFRAPARFTLLLHFGIAIVGAAVFDDLATLAQRVGRPCRRAIAWAFVTVVASGAVVVIGYWLTGRGLRRGAESLAIVAATALTVILAARGRRFALAILPAIVAFDLGAWGYSYVWWSPPERMEHIVLSADVPPGSVGDLVYTPEMSNLPVLAGYRVTNAYVALVPERRLDIGALATQRLAGVAWRRVGKEWVRVEHSMPRVRLVLEAVVSADPARDIQGVDIERRALVDTPVVLDGPAAHGSVRIVEDRPGELVVEVVSSGRALLVTTERFHQGWRATSANDGPLSVVRVNGDFVGCVVEPGSTTVRLTFAPRSLQVGFWISSAACLGLVTMAATATRLSSSHGKQLSALVTS